MLIYFLGEIVEELVRKNLLSNTIYRNIKETEEQHNLFVLCERQQKVQYENESYGFLEDAYTMISEHIRTNQQKDKNKLSILCILYR